MQRLFSPDALYCHRPYFLEKEKKRALTIEMHDGSVGSVKEGKTARWPQQEAFSMVSQDHCILLLHFPRAFYPMLWWRP